MGLRVNNNIAAINAQRNLESTIRSIAITIENTSAAESRIRDVDFAIETAELTRNQVLQQAGVSVLGQANLSAQSALSLL
jgi:flagellin